MQLNEHYTKLIKDVKGDRDNLRFEFPTDATEGCCTAAAGRRQGPPIRKRL